MNKLELHYQLVNRYFPNHTVAVEEPIAVEQSSLPVPMTTVKETNAATSVKDNDGNLSILLSYS